MARSVKGGGFGFVMLLVVLAAVLLLAARGWEKSGSAALALDPAATTPAQGSRDAGDVRDSLGDLPGLGEMRDATSRHTTAVEEALDATGGATEE